MILPPALALGVQLLMPVSDGVPVFNVDPVCSGIAEQGGAGGSGVGSDVAVEKKNCVDSEHAIRDLLVKQWSSFAPADKTACTTEATMGGDSSYTELLTCLEMARDVKNMKNEQQQNTAGNPAIRAPVGHAQPHP